MSRAGRLLALALLLAATGVLVLGVRAGPQRPGTPRQPDPAAPGPTVATAPAPSDPDAGAVRLVVSAGHDRADDANPGTDEQPLRTIGRGLELAVAANGRGAAAEVLVEPGVYREALALPSGGQRTDAPLVITGAGADRTIVSGADVLTGFVPQGDVFAYRWSAGFGLAEVPSGWEDFWSAEAPGDVVRRREVLTVDGAVVRQVTDRAGLDDPALRATGAFWVDDEAGRLLLRPPDGADPRTWVVEAAVRPRLFDSGGWSHVTVRGLALRQAATAMQEAAVWVDGSTDVLLEDLELTLHSWSGLTLRLSERVTVRRVASDGNGIMGVGAWRVRDLVLEDVSSSGNNWRGAWGGYRSWEAGSKLMGLRGARITGWRGIGNESHGLWLDYDNRDVVVDGGVVAGNATWGLYLEANPGPIHVRGLLACNNARWGVLDARSDDVTLTGSTLAGNGVGQLAFGGAREGRTVSGWDDGAQTHTRSAGWRVDGNVLAGLAGQALVVVELPGDEWDAVTETLEVRRNTYASTEAAPFRIAGRDVDAAGWRAGPGEDDAEVLPTEAPVDCPARRPDLTAPPG